MVQTAFPDAQWTRVRPEEVGFSTPRLDACRAWLTDLAGDEGFRFVLARHGRVLAEWNHRIEPAAQLNMASATKSYFSCLLAIAVAEGRIASPDAKVVDYYPQMMDVPEGRGPKPGRHAFEKDRDLTFRQCICNTSGYMKPGENPGTVWHYQTFGMNILCHAIATAYGMYDSDDPDRLPGVGELIETKLRDPIGGTWSYRYGDFPHGPEALTNIWGHSCRVQSTALDAARVGHLWLNRGRWGERQIVPEDYLRQAVVTAPDILQHEPRENWKYGHGFWTNDHGKVWPDLPRDSYAALGAQAKMTWVCPSLGLVVAACPGPWDRLSMDGDTKEQRQNQIVSRILQAMV